MTGLLAPFRIARRLTVVASLATLALPLGAQMTTAGDGKPTVAVMYFDNSALMRHADYEPLSKGIAEVLITELASNPRLRVVERDQLQKLLEEQNLGAGGRVDKETAAKIGRVLGVRHFLTGGFVIDTKERMRLDIRSINTETSQIEYTASVMGKADDVLALIDQLAEKVNLGLSLPAMPEGTRSAAVTPLPPKSGTPKVDQVRAVLALGRGLMAKDGGNNPAAVAAYREAVQAYPDFSRAKTLLASAETGKGASNQ